MLVRAQSTSCPRPLASSCTCSGPREREPTARISCWVIRHGHVQRAFVELSREFLASSRFVARSSILDFVANRYVALKRIAVGMVSMKKRRTGSKTTATTAAAAVAAAAHPAPAVTPRVVPSAAAAKKAAASQAKKAVGGAMAGSISAGGLEGLRGCCVDAALGVPLDGNPATVPVAAPLPPLPPPPPRKTSASSSASRSASAACQSTLIAQTLQLYGGIVQVITEAVAPYRVLAVSPAWQRLAGYGKHEVVGKPLKMMQATGPNLQPYPHTHTHTHTNPSPNHRLRDASHGATVLQGPRTEPEAVAALMRGVQLREPVSVRLTNYTKAPAANPLLPLRPTSAPILPPPDLRCCRPASSGGSKRAGPSLLAPHPTHAPTITACIAHPHPHPLQSGETFVHQLSCEPLRDEAGQAQCFQACTGHPGMVHPSSLRAPVHACPLPPHPALVSLAPSPSPRTPNSSHPPLEPRRRRPVWCFASRGSPSR